MITLNRALPLAGILSFGAGACSNDQQPPPHTAATIPAAAAVTESNELPADRSNERDTSVVLSYEITTRCELPDSRSEAPRFDYDQAALRARGENILDGVATCLTEGSLKGQTITLVGHTDPRGSDAYNVDLGQRRAAAARDYLVSRGVPSNQLVTISRGEEKARGTEDSTWALDRRVEVELGALNAGLNGGS